MSSVLSSRFNVVRTRGMAAAAVLSVDWMSAAWLPVAVNVMAALRISEFRSLGEAPSALVASLVFLTRAAMSWSGRCPRSASRPAAMSGAAPAKAASIDPGTSGSENALGSSWKVDCMPLRAFLRSAPVSSSSSTW